MLTKISQQRTPLAVHNENNTSHEKEPSLQHEQIVQRAIQSASQVHSLRDKAVGRNDACLCGSGKKYKKCCGRDV
ncbi:MAG: SEC-C domain-containing protein [Puniceicoccales bacterium]|nr:SEC-C domain-containing protein [Puniceicoccales bacterium]